MPAGKDWLDLARSTFHSVGRREISGLYAREWQLAKTNLIAEHREAIDAESRRSKRFLRTANAVLFGLSKRLAPARRILFGAALLCILFSLEGPSVVRHSETIGKAVRRVVEYRLYFDNGMLWIALVLLVLLLAMELVDKINYRDELELARELQASLIPRELPEVGAFELGAYNRPANMVGGDIYDFVVLPDGRLAVLFGDASGHGMAAGLVMAVAHAAFRTQLEMDPTPCALFATMNRILCRTGGPRAFFSCAYLLLAPGGSFEASLAGHPPILRLDPSGRVKERIGTGAYPLGIRTELAWRTESAAVASGETLLLHSDGVTEARNAAEQEFGDARLEDSIRRAGSLPATLLVAAIARDLELFYGQALPEDDVTIAAIRRTN